MSATEIRNGASSLESEYEAAHRSAIVVDRSQLGMLKFTGKNRLDLINRMSTQNVVDLKEGEGAATILTTDIGRIIDRLILYASSDSVYCLTSEDNGQNIAQYLRRFVFYMDDFQIEDLGHSTAIFGIYGCQAKAELARLFGDADSLSLHHWRECQLDGSRVYLHRTDPIAGDGYFVMGLEQDKERILQHLVELDITPAEHDAFEYLRIESGQPRFGHELSTDYIPLEADLWSDVSFNKGCYTGQEIIARLESRGRLAKKLVSLRASEPLQPGQNLEVKGKKAGTITSAAGGPNGYLALGFLKTTFFNENTENEELQLTSGQVKVRLS